jgi:hypothetical protein
MTILLAMAALAAAPVPERVVASFRTADDLRMLKANNVRISLAEGSEGAALVEYQPAEWPNVSMSPAKPWDWRGYTGLAITIHNPGERPVEFGVRVDDDPSANGVVHCRSGTGSIAPGKTEVFALSLGVSPMAVGMRGLPAAPGYHALAGDASQPIDLGHIVALQVYMHAPKTPVRLDVGPIRLVQYVLSLDRIVDEFGQYTGADWPGKLHNTAGFAARRSEEDAAIKRAPQLPDRDKYGGWAKGPTLQGTGFFRTAKANGKWWLVTPEGHLFLSLGMDCVNLGDATITTGRERMFTWLPQKGGPLSNHIGHVSSVHSGPVKEGDTFSFLSANLERKYGRDYEKSWFDLALSRLRAWGFNTIGNWSDQRLYRNGRMPYVATAGIGGSHARVSSGSDYWGRMHDPFDPQFVQDVADSLKPVAERVKADPWCIGYFVDNELSWGGFGDDGGRYGLAYGALAEGPSSPAKREFLAQLKAKYRDVSALNSAWGTSFTSWSDLDAPYKPSGQASVGMKADMSAFCKSLARRYFRVIRDELRRLDPNHLYLGCRFAWRTPEAVAAAAELCDVISFNIYAPRVDPAQWASVTELDRPCIIGEFHFGALDRGMFHTGLVSVPDQNARASMYIDYVRSVIDNPAFVGCHWFQYVDEPLTGRWFDGENYNIGFVSVTDTPYPEMVAAAKQVHAEAYTRRYGTGRPADGAGEATRQ